MNGADLHTLTGAYALNALSGAERQDFRHHLAECEACAQEVHEFEATTARLGTAVAVSPPPEMKGQVLAQITQVRQVGPQVAPGLADLTERRRRRLRRNTPRMRRLPGIAVAASVAAAFACGVLAVYWYQQAQDAERSAAVGRQQTQRVSEVLGAEDSRAFLTQVRGGGRAMVVVSQDRDRAAFLPAGLPELPPSRTYQLWFNDQGTMRPAGLLRGGSEENGGVLMDGRVRGASGVGLTVEPAGGSLQPTTKPLMLLDLPALPAS